MTLARGMSGTDRIFSFTSSSRSRLPALLAIKKKLPDDSMDLGNLASLVVPFVPLAALAMLVKHERRLSRWLRKSPRHRRRKPAGPKGLAAR